MNVFPGVRSFRDVATVGNTMLILLAIQIQSNTGEFPDGIGVWAFTAVVQVQSLVRKQIPKVVQHSRKKKDWHWLTSVSALWVAMFQKHTATRGQWLVLLDCSTQSEIHRLQGLIINQVPCLSHTSLPWPLPLSFFQFSYFILREGPHFMSYIFQ